MFQILCIIVTVQMVKNYKAILSGANKYWKNCCDDTGMAERSYPASEVSGGGWEELPCVYGQGQWPRGATLCLRSVVARRRHPVSKIRAAARRSYPASEASGGREETPRIRDQGRPGEATSRPRPGPLTLRSHPEPEARGGSWEEPPTPKARAGSREEQPKQWWLRRHRRA